MDRRARDKPPHHPKAQAASGDSSPRAGHTWLYVRRSPLGDVQEERTHEGGDEAQQRQAEEAAGEVAGQVLHVAHVVGADDAAEIADRVDPRKPCAASAVPLRNIGGMAKNGPLEP